MLAVNKGGGGWEVCVCVCVCGGGGGRGRWGAEKVKVVCWKGERVESHGNV